MIFAHYIAVWIGVPIAVVIAALLVLRKRIRVRLARWRQKKEADSIGQSPSARREG